MGCRVVVRKWVTCLVALFNSINIVRDTVKDLGSTLGRSCRIHSIGGTERSSPSPKLGSVHTVVQTKYFSSIASAAFITLSLMPSPILSNESIACGAHAQRAVTPVGRCAPQCPAPLPLPHSTLHAATLSQRSPTRRDTQRRTTRRSGPRGRRAPRGAVRIAPASTPRTL